MNGEKNRGLGTFSSLPMSGIKNSAPVPPARDKSKNSVTASSTVHSHAPVQIDAKPSTTAKHGKRDRQWPGNALRSRHTRNVLVLSKPLLESETFYKGEANLGDDPIPTGYNV